MAETYTILIQETAERFNCGEDQYILAAMQKARAGAIHHGCHGGGCGVCKMRVVSGPVHYAKRMSRAHVSEEEQKAGVVLTCCIKPRGNLVLARV